MKIKSGFRQVTKYLIDIMTNKTEKFIFGLKFDNFYNDNVISEIIQQKNKQTNISIHINLKNIFLYIHFKIKGKYFKMANMD